MLSAIKAIERTKNHFTFTLFGEASIRLAAQIFRPAEPVLVHLGSTRCGVRDDACEQGIAPMHGTFRRIYLDFNASTPVAPEVINAMRIVLEEPYGNPSSGHWAGCPAREAIDNARMQVAGLLGCKVDEIVFTSGGSEANNHALKGVFFASGRADAHIVTTQMEHPAIMNPCRFLERLGATVTYLRVDGFGRVDPDDVRRALRKSTVLISIMHANNEVGTIQPIEEISQIAHVAGILLHSDAAQSVGKVGFTVRGLGVDLLSVAGHKLYAPKGVGVRLTIFIGRQSAWPSGELCVLRREDSGTDAL